MLREICKHGFRPMNPREINKSQRFLPQVDGLPILNGNNPVFGHIKKGDQHWFADIARDNLRHGKGFEYIRDNT